MVWVLHEAALTGSGCIPLARQVVRRAAALVGIEPGGQARFALAVAVAVRGSLLPAEAGTPACEAADQNGSAASCYGLEQGSASVPPTMMLGIDPAVPPLLIVELRASGGAGPGAWASMAEDDELRRLVDRCELVDRDQPTLRLGRILHRQTIEYEDIERLRSGVRDALCSDPEHELASLDRDLAAVFAENDRVTAELEDTNRGVVALYGELDERAEQLRQASDLKSRFLSNMSHEFRTPLNSILALTRLLLDRTDGDLTEEQERQVGYVRRSADSLTELVNDLLDLAKVEAGKLELRPQRFTVGALFGGLRGVMKPLQQSEAVDLVFDEPASFLSLFTDEAKVAQILRNLISNALKYTERGEVRVAASLAASADAPDTRHCMFTVRDTGIGITPENQELVFQEFIQVANRLQGRAKGTGLGLPLSRRLAELLGGTLTLRSKPGAGSVFTLSVPTVLPGTDTATPKSTMARRSAPSGVVLLIDDEETSRYVLRQMLSGIPRLRILEAENGAQGVRQAVQHKPDVILLDLCMPVMDGFEVLDRLGAIEGTKAIPVFVCTSSLLETADRVRLARARSVMPKGELSQDIIAAVVVPYLPSDAGG